MPVSNDYSRESAGLFQANPGVQFFTGYTIVGAPCTPECKWSYVDRTEEGKLWRFYAHGIGDDVTTVRVSFTDLANRAFMAEASLSQLSIKHHAAMEQARMAEPYLPVEILDTPLEEEEATASRSRRKSPLV